MQDLQFWSNVATIVSALLAVVAIAFVWWQVRQFRKAEESGARAYLSARLEIGKSRERPAMFLVLKNHGKSPALDVHIEFDHQNNWHYVEHWKKFPFIEGNRISQLLPGEERKYFLGTLVSGSRLIALKTEEATGTLIYSDSISDKRREQIKLTIRDMVFVAR
jgi:hypothetical protein